MYLSGVFLGYSFFEGVNPLPSPIAYNQIMFLGNCIVDNVRIVNKVLNNNEIISYDAYTTPTWTSKTILLANFDNTLKGGNIISLNEPIQSWDVYRQEVGSETLIKIGNVDVNTINIIDYETQANKQYIYKVFPITENTIGNVLESSTINTNYYGWYLIGTDGNGTYSYKLDLNVQYSGYQMEEDFTEYQTYQQYNAFSKGQRKFVRGNLSAIAGTINNNVDFLQSVDYIDELKNRLLDSTTKILKSRKGEIIKVKTHNVRIEPVENAMQEQLYFINFEFIECESV